MHELIQFLDQVNLPQLSLSHKRALCSPKKEEEIMAATASFPNCKALGEDVIPIEIYKLYTESLAPQLLKMYKMAQEQGFLPDSMTRSNLVLLLKPNIFDPNSYRPISFLPVDVKILAKILTMHLNECINIIYPDQSGFMPLKSTAINIRRVFLNMQTQTDNIGHCVLLSLDANKAFSSVEWPYLWQTLRQFGFGDTFISWVQLLYHAPVATTVLGRMAGLPNLSV